MALGVHDPREILDEVLAIVEDRHRHVVIEILPSALGALHVHVAHLSARARREAEPRRTHGAGLPHLGVMLAHPAREGLALPLVVAPAPVELLVDGAVQLLEVRRHPLPRGERLEMRRELLLDLSLIHI